MNQNNMNLAEQNQALFLSELEKGHYLLFDTSFLLSDRLNPSHFKTLLSTPEAKGRLLLLDSVYREVSGKINSSDVYLACRAKRTLEMFKKYSSMFLRIGEHNGFADRSIVTQILFSSQPISVFTNDTALAKDLLLLQKMSSFKTAYTKTFKLTTYGKVAYFKIYAEGEFEQYQADTLKSDPYFAKDLPTLEPTPTPAEPTCTPAPAFKRFIEQVFSNRSKGVSIA